MSAEAHQRRAPIRSITAILPAYNEAGNLGPVVQATLEALSDVVPSFDLIVVDDGSTDGTRRIGEELALAHPEVRVVHLPRRQGYGSAIRAGLGAATRQYVFLMDADRQYEPADLAHLVQWDDSYDVIWGYRPHRRDALPRVVLDFVYKVAARLMFGLKARDMNCGFKLIRGSTLAGLTLHSTGIALNAEILVRAQHGGAALRETGVRHYPRRPGEARGGTFWTQVRTVRELVALRRELTKERRLARSAARPTVAAPSQGVAPGDGSTPLPTTPAPEPQEPPDAAQAPQ